MRYYLRVFLSPIPLFILVECYHSTMMKPSSLENQHLTIAAVEVMYFIKQFKDDVKYF